MANIESLNELDGKVIIVTGSLLLLIVRSFFLKLAFDFIWKGANTGLGFATALNLASKGAHVILGCRDLNRGKAALDKIKTETKSETVYLEQIELSDFDSVRDFVKRFKQKWSHLDILINNAGNGLAKNAFNLNYLDWTSFLTGMVNETLAKNKDGIEMTFAVNHLGE